MHLMCDVEADAKACLGSVILTLNFISQSLANETVLLLTNVLLLAQRFARYPYAHE